jgi:two-component system cell cycle sensor histidine kinase/response regulator CckA
MNPISFINNFFPGNQPTSTAVKLKVNPLTLSFRDDQAGLEELFLSNYFTANLNHSRLSHLFTIFLYGISGILELVLFPESKAAVWTIRYGIVIPIFMAGLLFSFSAYYAKFWQLIQAFYILVTGGSFTMMIIVGPKPTIYSYYVGVIICMIFGYTYIRERFIYASVSGCLLWISYLLASIYIIGTPFNIIFHDTLYLSIANCLGMMICYFMEYSARRDFYLVNLYQNEREKVNVANLELEKRVNDRTNELWQTNEDLRQEISERQRAESALKESEEKYRLLVDNADTAIFIAQDQVIKFPNPRTLDLTGYSAKELASNPFSDIIFPEDRDMVFGRHQKRLAGKDLPNSYEFRILNKNGKKLWAHLNTALITWEGSPATLNFLRDITTQKLLETKLRQAQKMEAIGTLAGGVAHDLNNILSGIVSYPELLLLDLPGDSPLREPIETIQDTGKKAAAIVQDMLTLARRGVEVAEVINLNNIVSEYLNSPEYKKLYSYHQQVEVKTDLDPDLSNISGSPVHLFKTIMNLVSNAAEAMPKGGNISISTQNRDLTMSSKESEKIPAGKYAALSIADSGTGISAQDLDKIFEPFFTKKKMGRSGTGLGMAVVWGTVNDHDGYIDIQTVEGQGTTFTLYFPITHESPVEQKPHSSIDDLKGHGESVLVVDDVREQREIASKILKKLGYEATSVSSGEEAVQYMKENSADLLILDMIMNPGIDGFETYQKILEMHPDQKAIIASGFSETERVKDAQNLGAKIYVKKPYSIENIGKAVRAELHGGAKG